MNMQRSWLAEDRASRAEREILEDLLKGSFQESVAAQKWRGGWSWTSMTGSGDGCFQKRALPPAE
jgi:hypothetical protein